VARMAHCLQIPEVKFCASLLDWYNVIDYLAIGPARNTGRITEQIHLSCISP
jgi:hypothetical protein